MDAVDAVGQKVGDLVDGVGDADIPHGFGIVAVFCDGPLELDRQGRAAQGHHPFDLLLIGDRHDARFDGDADAGDFAPFEEAVESGVVKEELGNELAGAGVNLRL